jgi:hypothetical protein
MDAAIRRLVRQRASNCCEYCQLPQEAAPVASFQVEHIRAKQHHGDDRPENLALACPRCNLFKGPNLSAIDPESGEVVLIFNPREQNWDDHFVIGDFHVLGRTACGRATASLLQMNEERRVDARRELALSDETNGFDEA